MHLVGVIVRVVCNCRLDSVLPFEGKERICDCYCFVFITQFAFKKFPLELQRALC